MRSCFTPQCNFCAIDAEHHGLVGQNRRSAIAVDGRVFDRGAAPDDVTRGIQASRSAVPKVHINAATVDQRSRAGVTILAMNARVGVREDGLGPVLLPCFCVQAKHLQVNHRAFANRTSQVNLTASNRGGGPATAGDWLCPGVGFASDR